MSQPFQLPKSRLPAVTETRIWGEVVCLAGIFKHHSEKGMEKERRITVECVIGWYCFGHLGLSFAGDPLRECLICSRTAYPRAVIFSHLLLPLTVGSYLLSEFSGHSGISRPSPNRLGTFLQVQLQDGRDKYLRWRGTIPCRCRISRSVRRMWKIPDRSDTD